MGKRSVKKDKNIYQLSREALDLTREKASEQMVYISADRIEKIESEKSLPHPDEILTMAEVYKKPSLSNYYCSHECPIGQRYVPEVEDKDLSQIVLEMLASLNAVDKERNRLIEITADGDLSADEYADFNAIQEKLERISHTVNALKLWVEQTIASGKINKEELEKAGR